MNSVFRPLLLLAWCLSLLTLGTAQHGGKAEGKRVKFEPGATSATFRGTVRDGLEVEYELEAQAGQELIVRVVSNPAGSALIKVHGPGAKVLVMSCLASKQAEARVLGLPTASHCYEENPQLLRREGRTWSATLPESGTYIISVIKPEGDKGLSTYSITIVVPPAAVYPGDQKLSPAEQDSLEAAMRQFIASFKKKDVTAFLAQFSRTRFVYASNPLNQMRITLPYSELATDLRQKRGWYCSYLARCDELDAFIDNIGDGAMWRRIDSTTFVPPDQEGPHLTFVRWRKEAGRWVISEISYPQA